ncbi:MAG: WD40/YVTN/BNR-like repeat-containing protein [Bacteroidota bacterium]|jgi:photosystem II stability/assembly factor-like uncharacterized protein|nr:hypothetical protein [Ignavibacteria bacterium]MCU7497653.1 hypothetical protein [Ignavibacteria bacterium]MCU7511042.1 hypothetical protein [Ignavibacteria bacterium]MCU7518896.1 hypothetical protein [Ignavibacteria bacterium]MCU7523136.1 hypothetical protein [Ignavibacteria bacterium]
MVNLFKMLIFIFIAANIHGQQLFWKKLNGPSAGLVKCIVINKNGDVFAGTTLGVSRSTDHGETWQILAKSHDMKNTGCISFDSTGNVYVATNDSFYVSNDNGDSWKAVACFSNILTLMEYPSVLRVDPKNKLYLGTSKISSCGGRIYCSTDGGKNWENSSYGMSVVSVEDIFFCDNGFVLACTTDNSFGCENHGGIYLSLDDGKTWKKSDDGLDPALYKWTFSFAGNSKNQIFAATAYGIYKTQTNGLGWEGVNTGIRIEEGVPESMDNITVAPNDWIFASNQYTCYLSTNDGQSWAINTSGLDIFRKPYPEYSVAASPDGYVYFGGGPLSPNIFRSAKSLLTSVFYKRIGGMK